MTDWATVASLATAGGTLVLAVATFASIRSLGWYVQAGLQTARSHPPPEEFTSQIRDIYLPPGDTGFWQGALRDPAAEVFTTVRGLIEDKGILTVSVLYGNFDGGQRVISQFALRYEEERWLVSAGRHFQLDRPDPGSPA